MGRISDQKAGDYSGIVTLTVVPQVGGGGGCGSFVNRFVSEDGWATLAYEDLYPNIGDGDYNDMVVRYSVEENYNADNQLETVTLKFDPLARGAGYNHSFSLSLDGELDKSKNVSTITNEAFVGDALISVNYTDGGSYDRTFNNYDKEDDISVFNNTLSVLSGYANVSDDAADVEAKYITTVNITLANPELNLWSDRGADALLWYRPFLHVMNTSNDIDLSVINPNDGMIDENGNPFGLFVPFDWQWPLERVNIEQAYPDFSSYVEALSDGEPADSFAEQWYLTPANDDLVYSGGSGQ